MKTINIPLDYIHKEIERLSVLGEAYWDKMCDGETINPYLEKIEVLKTLINKFND